MEFLVFISTFAVYFAFDAFRHSDEFRFNLKQHPEARQVITNGYLWECFGGACRKQLIFMAGVCVMGVVSWFV